MSSENMPILCDRFASVGSYENLTGTTFKANGEINYFTLFVDLVKFLVTRREQKGF
jgi:hypothetical protein